MSILVSLFLMLYTSRDTLLFGTNSSGFMKFLGYVAIVILVLYWFFNGKISSSYVSISLILIGLGCITMLTTGSNIKCYYVFLLIILSAFFCASVKFDKFVEAYQKIMFFLAVCSIVAFVFYEIAYSVALRFPKFENESGVQFINLFFDMALVKLSYVPHRSFGIFREPGVYMIFLNLALIFELFFKKNNEKRGVKIHVVTYIIAMLLTLSTAGYIIMVLTLILYLFFGSNSRGNKKLKIVVFISIAACFLYFLFDDEMFNSVFGKLFSDNYSKSSRLESINVNLRMLGSNFEHFFTGLGFSFVEQNFSLYSEGGNMGDNTNTIFRVFATYGFFYVAMLTGLLFKFFTKVKNTFLAVCLFGVFVLCLFNESLIVNILLYLLSFYAIDNS